MKLSRIFKTTTLLLILFFTAFHSFSQDTTYDDDGNPIIKYGLSNTPKKKGFRMGLYLGALFANQYTANIYDGYGFQSKGVKNDFTNSTLNNDILIAGGQNGTGTDYIAQALGNITPNSWTFGPNDMPINMRYIPAFVFGLNTIYSVDKKNAILLNVNAAKLAVAGNFEIEVPLAANQSQVSTLPYQVFPIVGSEERLMFQMGYQRIIGNNDNLNLLIEGGLDATLAKYYSNAVILPSPVGTINLATVPTQAGLPTSAYLPVQNLIGIGFGFFTGIGANLTMNEKYTIQLVYSPNFEKINMGVNPEIKLQNAVGLRSYYNF